uniref:MARVEL domain-containing protein n=1 Tax=Parastrongyloides trichosuri TaxID=131310 RepID=A0A0N4Z422_PARTI
MSNIAVNTGYLTSSRGVIKICQIIAGLVVSSFLCSGPGLCFGESRVGFTSFVNSVCVIVNIILLILNFLSISNLRLERVYSIICTILFIIAVALMVWYFLQYQIRFWTIITTVLLIIQAVLFLWDYKILNGEAPNEARVI